jgi:hypothetical protein
MRDEIRRLQAELARLPDGNGRRFPATARREIARLAQELRREGKSWREAAATLGVTMESVRRFCQEEPAGFARVEVIDAEAKAVLVSPSGYRVEGLSVAALAELLERLR